MSLQVLTEYLSCDISSNWQEWGVKSIWANARRFNGFGGKLPSLEGVLPCAPGFGRPEGGSFWQGALSSLLHTSRVQLPPPVNP